MDQELDKPAITLLEEHVRRLLYVMGFNTARVTCDVVDAGTLRIHVEAGDVGRMLIGVRGAHLLALQHIVRCLLRPQLPQEMRVVVDVNGYRISRERSLLGLAEEVARKAHRTGRTVVLQPMPAADRRTIHTALAGHKDITTESLGDEPNRRVVVRPVFL
jgi:spoIIIJ-associated protein